MKDAEIITDYTEHLSWRCEGHESYAIEKAAEVRRDRRYTAHLEEQEFQDSIKSQFPWSKTGSYQDLRVCPYCESRMIKLVEEWKFNPAGGFRYRKQNVIRMSVCSHCSWWYQRVSRTATDFRGEEGKRVVTRYSYSSREGIAKRFRVDDKRVPLDELRKFLAKNRDRVYEVSPNVFERLVASIYADFFPGSVVRHVGGPGDDGIDLYAIINDAPHAIQIKHRRRPDFVERPAVVRELLGSMLIAGISNGHLVTTAEGFGPSSKKYAAMVQPSQIELSLLSVEEVFKILEVANGRLGNIWDPLLLEERSRADNYANLDALEG